MRALVSTYSTWWREGSHPIVTFRVSRKVGHNLQAKTEIAQSIGPTRPEEASVGNETTC